MPSTILHKIGLKVILNSCERVFRVTSKLERLKMGHAYAYLQVFKESEFPFLAPDGRRNFSGSSKCRQWLHSYKSYEATYTLKCLLFVKIAKNWFSAPVLPKFSVFGDFLKN